MKIIKCIIFIFLVYSHISAQQITFKGILYEHNSKTNTGKLKPITNAQIIIPLAVPTISDNTGKFKTESDGYKLGQSAKLIIKKSGYEVVNIKDLENVIAGSLEDVKVFLAPQNLLYEAQLKYYNLAKKSIETSFDSKLNQLIAELNKNKKLYNNNQEGYNEYLKSYSKKTQELENERSSALKSAQDVAKNIAEINLDFADNLYKRAIGFFLKGNLDSCIILLNSKQFSIQEQKAISNINKLNTAINQEAQILKKIIEKDLFRAQLYQTKLQMDSVSSICKKTSELTIKYADQIGMKDFIEINKKIIGIDPNYTFQWLNNDYFEDVISIVRLKSGRSSLDEAEVIRLQGVYKMNIGEGDKALELLNKSLTILKKNSWSDSAMVLTNLLELGIKFDIKVGRDAFQLLLVKNPKIIPGLFQENPYWFETIFNDPKSIEYGIKTLYKAYETYNYTNDLVGLINNALSYVLNPKNIRNYSSEFITFLKVAKIKITADRNNWLTSKNLEQLINYGDQMNVNSFDYLNYLQAVSKLYLEEIASTKNHQEDNKDIILKHINRIFPELQNNIYFNKLTGSDKFKYEMVNTIFMFILIKTKNNSFSTDDYIAKLNTTTLLWGEYFLDDKGRGIYFDNAYNICKLYWKTYGCNFGNNEMKKLFLELSEGLAKAGTYNGVNFYKTFLELAVSCDDSISVNTNFSFHFEKLLNYTLRINENLLDTGNARYGIMFTPVFDEKSPFFSSSNSKCLNNIEEYYYGSDYAINVGKTGIVTKLNEWEYKKTDNIDYDSLWLTYSYYCTIGNEQKTDQIFEMIYNNSMAKFVSQTNTIDSIKFSDSKSIYSKFSRFNSNISYSIWKLSGNSSLDGLDFFFYKLMQMNDEHQDYSKNIKILYKFDSLGLTGFFLGYSKSYGIPIQYLSHIYSLGIKATLIKKDTKAYDDVLKIFNSTYARLSEKNKILFLNDFIWSTFDQNRFKLNNSESIVDFNTQFINELYTDFEKLLNDSLLTSKSENFEDRVFENEREHYILESYLTLSGASYLDNFNPAIFIKLKKEYPKEARVYRNEALYYFLKNDVKLGVLALQKAIELGFKNQDFFTKKLEIKKFHTKIINCFKN